VFNNSSLEGLSLSKILVGSEDRIQRRIVRWSQARNQREGDSYLLHASFLLGLFFYPEDGGNILTFRWLLGVTSKQIEFFRKIVSPQTCQTVCTHKRKEEQRFLWKDRRRSSIKYTQMNYCLKVKQGVHSFLFMISYKILSCVYIHRCSSLRHFVFLFFLLAVAMLLFIDSKGWQHLIMKYG
jgi:hypothetical protein